MKRIIHLMVILACCGCFSARAQLSTQVMAVQYYFNTDPGPGNNGNGGIVAFAATDTLTQQFNFGLPPGLPLGVNYLYIRVQDNMGRWGLSDRKSFFVQSASQLPQDVSAIQYYFDTDPGLGNVGNGGIVPITPDSSINQNLALNIPGSLGSGLHYLYIRVQNTSGNWSLNDRRAFYVLSAANLAVDISAVQYYFDTDPGLGIAGNGGIVPITPDSSINQNFAFNLPPSLGEGLHYLYIRTQNQNGEWSISDRRAFFVTAPYFTSQLTALEYYYDNDPGLGMANAIALSPVDTVSGIYQVVAPCLPSGDHYLYIRAQNTDGSWSLIDRDTINIISAISPSNVTPAGPLAICPGDSVELSFTASAGVTYQWIRNGVDIPGADSSSYFVTQAGNYSVRSTCGASFAVSNTVNVNTPALLTFYADNDNDGFGDANDSVQSCTSVAGYVADSTDCNDNDSLVNPAAVEICNGIDDNCDGQIDEGLFAFDTTTVTICENDSALIAGLYRSTAGFYSDTAVFAASCDSVLVTELIVNPVDTLIRNSTTADSAMAGVFTQTLTNQFGCDSLVIDTVTYVPAPCATTDSTFISSITCDSALAGVMVVTLTGSDGCDSVVTTTVVYDPPTLTILPTVNICQGQSANILGVSRNMDGVYTDTLQNVNGCDSVLQQTLVVNPVFAVSTAPINICQGDSVLLAGAFRSTSGTYVDSLLTVNRCDSIVSTQLIVDTLIQTFSTQTICQGDSAFIQGAYRLVAGTFVDTVQSVSGCDSVNSTSLFVIPTSNVSATASICQGDSILLGGGFQTMAGVYVDIFTSSNLCDSILTTTLTVNPVDTTQLSTTTGDSTQAGVFTQILGNRFGCDSVVITTVTYVPGPCAVLDSVTLNQVTCDSALAGTTVQTFNGTDGCDSIVTTIVTYSFGGLNFLPDKEICQGDSILVFGVYRSISGVYRDTVQNKDGCDSILVCLLRIKLAFHFTVTDSLCPGDSLLVGGAWQTTAGTYTDITPAGNGCNNTTVTTIVIRDSSDCAVDTSTQGCLSIVSDISWMQSTVVDPSNFSGYWPGSPGLPATATFTQPVVLGQPYGYPSIQQIQNTDVIKTGHSVTYFRKEFVLSDASGLDVRLLITVDDQAEIFLNGQQAALISTFGRPNYKFPAHDVKFGGGVVSNGFMGGDSYDVTATAATVNGALQVGANEVIVAVRNLGKPSDIGGFSFRMDINCDDNGITEKSAEASFNGGILEVFPNPVQEMLTIRDDISITSIRVFDFSGKLVQGQSYAAEKQVKINMKGLASGVYFIEVGEVGNTAQRIKVMKD